MCSAKTYCSCWRAVHLVVVEIDVCIAFFVIIFICI